MPDTLHIITPAGRPANLPRLAKSIAKSGLLDRFIVVWWIVYNGPIDAPQQIDLPCTINHISFPAPGYDADGRPAFGHAQRAHALDLIGDGDRGWVWVLDDDNLIHPQFADGLTRLISEHPDARGFLVGQRRSDGAQFPTGPMFCRPGYVDTAQYIVRRDLIGPERIQPVYADDGAFIGRLVRQHPNDFIFTPEPLTYHNAMTFIAEE